MADKDSASQDRGHADSKGKSNNKALRKEAKKVPDTGSEKSHGDPAVMGILVAMQA